MSARRTSAARLARRRGLSRWSALLVFAIGTALVLATAGLFLKPALAAWTVADDKQKRLLGAAALLMLAALLTCLLIVLILALPLGRSFASRKGRRPSATKYTDAWSESAKRMATPPPEEDEGPGS